MNKYFLLIVSALLFFSACKPQKNDLPVITALDTNWQFKQADSGNWMPAEVPGSVHTDLMKNGVIENPYYRLNEHHVQWVDKKDWLYKTSFKVDDQLLAKDRVEINFEGLDTYADVYLNDTLILSANNMFRAWNVDVKKWLKKGDNELRVFLHSPTKVGLQKYDSLDYTIPVSDNDQSELGGLGNKKVSVFLRKAGYHFGWDWGPRLVTSGIWKDVVLKGWNEALIRDVNFRQKKLTEARAEIETVVKIEALENKQAHLLVKSEDKQLADTTVALEKGVHEYHFSFAIDKPELWFPNGAGEQKLYRLAVQLRSDGGLMSEGSKRIGLRTLEVVQKQDSAGESFYLKVNGRPLFMKGANYIPQDVFLNRVSPERYRHIIESAAKTNMNMLRVWGGGIYEKDIFYDLCDEYGILVWQDFMFACAMFPGDSAFLNNVKLEAKDNIIRLRNHPSIALYCGNNECQSAWFNWGWRNEVVKTQGQEVADKLWQSYTSIFHEVLPEAVKKYDPDRFYWSSSPQASRGVTENYTSGDMHYWGVWWGQEPFENYETKIPRFMSEYGFQSFPQLTTVKKYALPEDWDIYSDVMKSHQRSSIGNGTIENYMLRHYKKPKDFPMFLYVGQLLQAEGIKQGMEAHRTNMPYCMGSLFWQIDDCWPVASWSSIDYYGEWKAEQYFAAKAFNNILISPDLDGDAVKVAVISDLPEAVSANMELSVIDFNGEELWNHKEEVSIDANSSKVFYANDVSGLGIRDTSGVLLYAKLVDTDDKVLSDNILYFANPKNLHLQHPDINYTISGDSGNYVIKLKSDRLAKNVYIVADGVEGFFSDNYFDLLPGKPVEVSLKTTQKVENLKNKIAIISLVDSY